MPAPQYGGQHQALLAQLRSVFKPGSPCMQAVNGKVCGKPMWRLDELDLGHDDFGGYIGLVHKVCNRRAGAIKGNRNRGRTCRNPLCRRKFLPTRRRQSRCAECRGLTTASPVTVSGGRAW